MIPHKEIKHVHFYFSPHSCTSRNKAVDNDCIEQINVILSVIESRARTTPQILDQLIEHKADVAHALKSFLFSDT